MTLQSCCKPQNYLILHSFWFIWNLNNRATKAMLQSLVLMKPLLHSLWTSWSEDCPYQTSLPLLNYMLNIISLAFAVSGKASGPAFAHCHWHIQEPPFVRPEEASPEVRGHLSWDSRHHWVLSWRSCLLQVRLAAGWASWWPGVISLLGWEDDNVIYQTGWVL